MTSGIRAPAFFIIGAGRSGTTLVQNILSAHPAIAVPPETHIMKLAARTPSPDGERPACFDSMWRELIAWSRFRDLGIDAAEVRDRLDRSGREDFASIFAAILTAYADAHGAARAGEKTPGHYRFLPQLERWYPNAKFIVMRRDPRDVVASQLRTPWVRKQQENPSPISSFMRRTRFLHAAEHAIFWRDAYGRFLAGKEDDPRYRLVVYEDLARDPGRVMADVFAFLGEDFDPSLLAERPDRTHSPKRPGDQWAERHHAAAAQPISTKSIGRWRDALSSSECALVEAICGDVMEDAGYARSTGAVRRGAGSVLGRGALAADALEDRLRAGARRLFGIAR